MTQTAAIVVIFALGVPAWTRALHRELAGPRARKPRRWRVVVRVERVGETGKGSEAAGNGPLAGGEGRSASECHRSRVRLLNRNTEVSEDA